MSKRSNPQETSNIRTMNPRAWRSLVRTSLVLAMIFLTGCATRGVEFDPSSIKKGVFDSSTIQEGDRIAVYCEVHLRSDKFSAPAARAMDVARINELAETGVKNELSDILQVPVTLLNAENIVKTTDGNMDKRATLQAVDATHLMGIILTFRLWCMCRAGNKIGGAYGVIGFMETADSSDEIWWDEVRKQADYNFGNDVEAFGAAMTTDMISALPDFKDRLFQSLQSTK